MKAIRQIIDDAPEYVPIPKELQHHRIELIIFPLSRGGEQPGVSLHGISDEEMQTPSFHELAKDFCGMYSGWPPDLSTNPASLEGFGKDGSRSS